jgi:hypothetical protein
MRTNSLRTEGSTTGNLALDQEAYGGNSGGNPYGTGSAGIAGSGYNELNKSGAWTQLSITTKAGGGDGGYGIIGGNGAAATAKSNAVNTHGGSLSTAIATAGKGGGDGTNVGGANSISGAGGNALAESDASGNGDFQNVVSSATSTAGLVEVIIQVTEVLVAHRLPMPLGLQTEIAQFLSGQMQQVEAAEPVFLPLLFRLALWVMVVRHLPLPPREMPVAKA